MSHESHPYSASGAWFLDNPFRRIAEPPQNLVEKLGVTSEMTAVDFGCGPGYFTVELAKRAGKVVAVDLSEKMLQKAKQKVSKAGLGNTTFLQSDGTSIRLSGSFVDLILLVTVFHEIGDKPTVLKEFSRILGAKGRLVIVEVIKKGPFAFAPLQNPQTLQANVEAEGFKLQELQPYKSYGIFFFTKTS